MCLRTQRLLPLSQDHLICENEVSAILIRYEDIRINIRGGLKLEVGFSGCFAEVDVNQAIGRFPFYVKFTPG